MVIKRVMFELWTEMDPYQRNLDPISGSVKKIYTDLQHRIQLNSIDLVAVIDKTL